MSQKALRSPILCFQHSLPQNSTHATLCLAKRERDGHACCAHVCLRQSVARVHLSASARTCPWRRACWAGRALRAAPRARRCASRSGRAPGCAGAWTAPGWSPGAGNSCVCNRVHQFNFTRTHTRTHTRMDTRTL